MRVAVAEGRQVSRREWSHMYSMDGRWYYSALADDTWIDWVRQVDPRFSRFSSMQVSR